EYEFKNEWRAAEVRHEIIEVRDGESVEIDVPVTHHGPVISQSADGTKAIAFRYTATTGPNLGYESLLDMLLAKKRAGDRKSWLESKGNLAEVLV
ncbi:MAG: hypothetical protein CMK91_01195, partial [Pseudomonas sp.]|nr:hypothetical protein [Pseudomonas sp.]